MSILDLYSNGKHKQEIGHFASIVKIAKANGKISKEEENLLLKASKKLNISDEEYKKIYENPNIIPVNPPVGYDERIERLYFLTKMIFADNQAELKEVKLLRKIAIALGFSTKNAEKICDEAVHLVLNDNNLDDFSLAIKKVDRVLK